MSITTYVVTIIQSMVLRTKMHLIRQNMCPFIKNTYSSVAGKKLLSILTEKILKIRWAIASKEHQHKHNLVTFGTSFHNIPPTSSQIQTNMPGNNIKYLYKIVQISLSILIRNIHLQYLCLISSQSK